LAAVRPDSIGLFQELNLFDSDIVEKYTSKSLEYLSTKHAIELDIFIRDKKVAFEYQGEQHYFDLAVFGDQEETAQRDAERRVACIALNITLIDVPYWWNEYPESLLNSLHFERPDLVPKLVGSGLPIPDEPVVRPNHKLLSMKDIKEVK